MYVCTRKVTEQNFFKMSWEEFESYSQRIADDISSFCEKESISIDFICPIIRGGSVLATYLSHRLDVIPCIGVQLKNLNSGNVYESPKLMYASFSCFSRQKRTENEYTVLLVEGNHCSGGTALVACKLLRQYFPNIKIIYASLARDYAHKDIVSDVIFSTTGYYSNESNANYSREFMVEHKIQEKYVVFPWEVIQEELDECNHLPVAIKTPLFD